MNRSIVWLSLLCSIGGVLLCWKVLGFIPHVPDELSYLYQGRILASGRFWMEAPEIPEAFTVAWDHILREQQRWRSIYPPGWPLLLAAGWLIRAPWLINPLLAGLTVAGVYKLAKQLFDARTALYGAIAFAASPFVLLMASSFMSHQAALCFSVWCVFFMMRGGNRDFLIAGALGGFAFLVRPFTAFVLLAPVVLWNLWIATSKGKTPAALKVLLHLAAGVIPFMVIFAIYNHVLFGSIFRTGYSYEPAAQCTDGWLSCLRSNGIWYFAGFNRSLWGWPWPDMLILIPLFFPRQKWKSDVLLAIPVLTLMFAYAIFFSRDIVYSGPRYVYEGVGFVAILSARSLILMQNFFERRVGRTLPPVVLLLFVYPLLSTLPRQIAYHQQAYHGQSKELLELVETRKVGNDALILIEGDPYVFRTFFLENSLNPADSKRVYARDVEGKRDRIIEIYSRNEVWRMEIKLELYEGRNPYADRGRIVSVKWERLR